MDVGSVASDHELAIGPLGIFVSADEEDQDKLFENVIVGGFKFLAMVVAENFYDRTRKGLIRQ